MRTTIPEVWHHLNKLEDLKDPIDGDFAFVYPGFVYGFKDGKWGDPVDIRARPNVLRPGIAREDGSLYDLGWYLSWKPGDQTARLDGSFTADELTSIADHMRSQEFIRQQAEPRP
jgi:hypothetical protein